MLKSIFNIASVLLSCGMTFASIILVPADQPTIQTGEFVKVRKCLLVK